ncbi:hypothetical protein [Glutamicibacter endophyticus]|uniref:hypothetical protein n=1 Tax=Glutamicibacter endophyticus TaxID=1522174 RepID=UPI003AF1398A
MLAISKFNWLIALVISLTALLCGSIALFTAGVVADENNAQHVMSTPLWVMFGLGVLGTLVALPGCVAAKRKNS